MRGSYPGAAQAPAMEEFRITSNGSKLAGFHESPTNLPVYSCHGSRKMYVALIYSFICLNISLGADLQRMARGREFNMRIQPGLPSHICANAAISTPYLRSKLIQ